MSATQCRGSWLLTASVALAVTATAAQAETRSAGFGVTVVLQAFSDTVTADQRCTQSSITPRGNSTVQIHCPAAVDVQTIARSSSSLTGQKQRMNPEAMTPASSAAPLGDDGKRASPAHPIELTISW